MAAATETWAMPPWWPASVIASWAPACRGASLHLSGWLVWEVEKVRRVLFALNRQCEPDWK